jgi:hypothetical protein
VQQAIHDKRGLINELHPPDLAFAVNVFLLFIYTSFSRGLLANKPKLGMGNNFSAILNLDTSEIKLPKKTLLYLLMKHKVL